MNYDAIILGVGQAGPPLAARLTAAGQRVALVERKHPGGTCVNTGCIPTKTLVASARAAHIAAHASDYGVVIDGAVRVDMAQVKRRKDEVPLASRRGVTECVAEGVEEPIGHDPLLDHPLGAVEGELEDRLAACVVDGGSEPLGDLGQGGVPVDRGDH